MQRPGKQCDIPFTVTSSTSVMVKTFRVAASQCTEEGDHWGVDFLAQYDEDENPFTVHDITCTLRDAGQKAGDILSMLENERQRDNDERARREGIEDERARRERLAHEQIHAEQQDHRRGDQSQQRLIDPRIRQASVSSLSSSGVRQRGIDLEALINEPDSVRREEGYLQRIADLEERLAAARGSSSAVSGSSVASRSSSRGYRKRREDIDDLGSIQEEVKAPARPQTPHMLAPTPAQDLRGIIDLTLLYDDDENRDELESDSTHEANIP